MVTRVGTQTDFSSAIKELTELEFDAGEAYEAAIARLDNAEYKKSLNAFLEDHRMHLVTLKKILVEHQVGVPEGPTVKSYLTKGKVVIAGLVGDKAILKAMISNEDDTNSAYERMVSHSGCWAEVRDFLLQSLEDERRHKDWLVIALRE